MSSENGDLITDWFQYTSATQDDRSPEIYRKWSGISLVAGAMERKVWVKQTQLETLHLLPRNSCPQFRIFVEYLFGKLRIQGLSQVELRWHFKRIHLALHLGQTWILIQSQMRLGFF